MAGARSIGKYALGLAAAVMLSGCGGFLGSNPDTENMTAQEIYALAEKDLDRGRPDDAAHYFGEIERLYPYSEWGKRALIMQAYSYHRDRDYENSRAAAQRYLDIFPADEDAAYAHYLLALSYYDQIDDVGRDQGLTKKALQSLREVIDLYPNTDYAKSAKLKFELAFDHLAAKEMEVGRYYLKRGHYTAAINRFRIVVEDFQTTSQTPEALYRLVEAYLALGLDEEAQTAGAILGHNYQSTDWYADAYALLTGRGLNPEAKGDGWLTQVYRQVILGKWL
ncbi:MAG: outer membrane protein assembly factor BamD [Paracoccaceae bacterium]|nr:outer membrane protein assembly factor BamD [Paracoccaceae bacterium]